MDRIPTYQDITRARAEREATQNQMAERDALANEVQSRVTPNPVLSEYMNRGAQQAQQVQQSQQGLIPREDSAEAYTMFASNVANKVEDQETYSMVMIDAALKGQVPVGAVLEDESILPQFKQDLVNSASSNTQNSGLGQIK